MIDCLCSSQIRTLVLFLDCPLTDTALMRYCDGIRSSIPSLDRAEFVVDAVSRSHVGQSLFLEWSI